MAQGVCLDVGFLTPYHWNHGRGTKLSSPPEQGTESRKNFLTPDYAAIDNEFFFVRGVLNVPIIGTSEFFRWGIWGSLSRENFDTLLAIKDDSKRSELPPMFSWSSSRLPGYPETLNLKMYANIQKVGSRPHFELQEGDHPRSQEYHHGITPERVREIMVRHLREAG